MSQLFKKSVKSLTETSNKIIKNKNSVYLGIILVIILSIGYYINKNFNAIIFLYLITAVAYLLTKNILISLIVSILLTNFLISINFFMDSSVIKESMEGSLKKIKNLKENYKKVLNTNLKNQKKIEENKAKLKEKLKKLQK